jgi:hypothetical protein
MRSGTIRNALAQIRLKHAGSRWLGAGSGKLGHARAAPRCNSMSYPGNGSRESAFPSRPNIERHKALRPCRPSSILYLSLFFVHSFKLCSLIIARPKKDFIERAKEKRGTNLPASVNPTRILKKLNPGTLTSYQRKLNDWYLLVYIAKYREGLTV